ncbi:hypothetical protein JS533_013605, partial [Bifidobacterium amazonense]
MMTASDRPLCQPRSLSIVKLTSAKGEFSLSIVKPAVAQASGGSEVSGEQPEDLVHRFGCYVRARAGRR